MLSELKVSLRVKPREGEEYVGVHWLPDSGMYRTLITERMYKRKAEICPQMKLRKCKGFHQPVLKVKKL